MGLGVFLAIPSKTFSKRAIPAPKAESLSARLSHVDFLGVFVLISTVVLFLYGLSTPHITYSTIIASAFTLLVFLIIESNPKLSNQPILPLSVLNPPPSSWPAFRPSA
jgi:hypothetical protein